MSRLSLKVFYLWHHVSLTAPPFILWWWNLELLFAPLNRSSPFIGELRWQASQMEHALIQQRGPKAQSILWGVCGSTSYIISIKIISIITSIILLLSCNNHYPAHRYHCYHDHQFCVTIFIIVITIIIIVMLMNIIIHDDHIIVIVNILFPFTVFILIIVIIIVILTFIITMEVSILIFSIYCTYILNQFFFMKSTFDTYISVQYSTVTFSANYIKYNLFKFHVGILTQNKQKVYMVIILVKIFCMLIFQSTLNFRTSF
jgi:hypothetical protein